MERWSAPTRQHIRVTVRAEVNQALSEEEKLRLFAAVRLPEEWLAVLSNVRANLERVAADELKWVRPELMHLTLVFLGYQPSERLHEIESALGTSATEGEPFRLSLGNLGTFGPPHGITVLWAGLDEVPAPLEQLHRSITAGLAEGRIEFDHKPLVPHITLARGRRPINREISVRVAGALKGLRLPGNLTTAVEEFVLMRSRLSPKGPSYEMLRRFQLGDSHSV